MSKFHTTLRSFAPLAAGATNMGLARFLMASLISCVIWTAVLLAPVPAVKALVAG